MLKAAQVKPPSPRQHSPEVDVMLAQWEAEDQAEDEVVGRNVTKSRVG